MATSNHGPADDMLRSRFIDEVMGLAERQFPHGRVGHDDDGQLTFAIAADRKANIIRVVFSKPTAWIGFDEESAVKMRDALSAHIDAMWSKRGTNAH